jgi:hypothetical protein
MKTNETLYLKSLNLQNFATFENQIIQFDINNTLCYNWISTMKGLKINA